MSDGQGQIWINLPRFREEYIKGVKDFVGNAMVHYAVVGNAMVHYAVVKDAGCNGDYGVAVPSGQFADRDATPPEEEKKKKTRGKTKLNHIHTRGEKREIKLSDLGQPVDDDDNLISEFSSFLGTTVREFVSLTCRSWLEVPQKNILWQYVKKVAAIERALTAKPDEPPAPITDADVYVKTRKRTTGREYKLPTDVVEKKIEDVEKLLKEGTVEDANELVYGGKDHKHSFLVGRLNEKREPKKRPRARQIPPTIPDQYVTSLTEKIREQIAQEMEEKVAKQVQENVKLMISKLAEKNPELKLDIEDLSVEPSRAKDSIRGNENNTP
ncbi:hypothetical protein OROMI_002786 [Orobanche minor]